MKIFLRLLRFLSKYTWQIVLAILLGSVMVASNMLLLGMAAYLIAAAALGPLLIALILPTYIVRFMSVSRATSRYAERMISHNVTFRLLAQIRTWVYHQLEPLAPAYLVSGRSGDVLTRLVSDVEELQNIYLRAVSPVIIALVIGIVTFGLFTIFNPVLAWVAVAFLIVTGFGVPLLTGYLARGIGQQQLAVRAELNAQLADGIQGIQDLLVCGHTGSYQQKIEHLNTKLAHIQYRMALITALQQTLNELLMNVAVWTLLILAIPLVSSNAIAGVYLGFLALIILASFEAISPLASALQFMGHFLEAGKRLFAITDMAPVVTESTNPISLAVLPATSENMLSFENVHFGYTPEEAAVLKGISFQLAPGKKIAIVGPSGSGKSTLVKLAVRFWDPTQGAIHLKGVDIRHVALSDLRSQISVVDQETYLFNDTIRGNLLLANPQASAEQIELALEQAQLADFIHSLPQGLETWVGEQGLRLSGGERQRLAVARALLKEAPLLILDEATANLDALREQALLHTIKQLMQGKTVLMITHRLIGMEEMDEILVLNQGHIQERGTHAELLAQGGLYKKMFAMQNELLLLS